MVEGWEIDAVNNEIEDLRCDMLLLTRRVEALEASEGEREKAATDAPTTEKSPNIK